ncbi:MAG: UTP--glucose-1-phosphate uridylyltransferase GalU [Oscillospiraceae bacterium]|nr:UTP--glucose-1-phosphate uridylyltransferase GalU [Oscillospiraceae bacterium]
MIRKAVIPAAGFGTRVLPMTKAVPKEMLPIVDKPSIQYIVEECVKSGITDILIITSRGKETIENHFDKSPELERALSKPGKEDVLQQVQGISDLANIYYLRQKEAKGLGHAILCAKDFTGDEPFMVLYPDDVIFGEKPVALQLIEAYNEFGKACVGIKAVSQEAISKYSSLKIENIRDNIYTVTDMIEKPAKGQEFSLYSILGRCLLTADIYPILENTKPGAGGEIQLTDAMAVMAREGKMNGVDFVGKRYDMGNKLGVMMANVEQAVKHDEIGEDFKAYLKEFVKNI